MRLSPRLLVYLRLIGMIMLIACTTSLVITFIIAYLSPTKMVIVDINSLGEADLELALFLLTIPLMLYVFIDHLKEASDLLQILK